MKTVSTPIIWLGLVATVGLFVVYPVWSNQVPTPPLFQNVTVQVFTGLMGWLFAVALLVERAVEVVVMVFRDQQADLLDYAEDQATKAVADATQKANGLAGDNPGKEAAANAVIEAGKNLASIQYNKVIYRAETKEVALLTGFAFGIFVSLAGVRALHGLVAENAPVGTLFNVADIVVTGAMLAGGSEGIHRMANAFTSFMDALSARGDQAQRNAQPDTKPKP